MPWYLVPDYTLLVGVHDQIIHNISKVWHILQQSIPGWQSIVKQVSPSYGRSYNFSVANRWERTAGWRSRGMGWRLQQEPCCEYALNAALLLLISCESLLIPWKPHRHLEFCFDMQTLISTSSHARWSLPSLQNSRVPVLVCVTGTGTMLVEQKQQHKVGFVFSEGRCVGIIIPTPCWTRLQPLIPLCER